MEKWLNQITFRSSGTQFFHLELTAPMPVAHLPQTAKLPSMRATSPKLTPGQKLKIASRLYATARKVKMASLRVRHRDWSEQQLSHELNRRFFFLRD